MRNLHGIVADEKGATAVEYGLILALVFLAMVGAVAALATETSAMWNSVAAAFTGS